MREWSQRLIFHIALTMGGCYMAMVLTAWDTTGMHAGNADMAAFWIKLGKSYKSERDEKTHSTFHKMLLAGPAGG